MHSSSHSGRVLRWRTRTPSPGMWPRARCRRSVAIHAHLIEARPIVKARQQVGGRALDLPVE